LETQRLLPGSLLVAHPLMKPNLFSKSVVLIIESHNRLCKGLIVNKKSPYFVKDVLADCAESYVGQSTLYKGGPINSSAMIMLHSNEWYSANTMQVGKELAISSDHTMVEKLSEDNNPYQYKIIAGVSQWAEAQLRNEFTSTAEHKPYWLTLNKYDTELLFDLDVDSVWDMAIDYYSQNMYDQYF
jgi:putative transcriptional regulator